MQLGYKMIENTMVDRCPFKEVNNKSVLLVIVLFHLYLAGSSTACPESHINPIKPRTQ